MALISTTLGQGLASMVPTDNEQDAVNSFSSAWETYFKDAAVLGTPTTPGSLSGAVSAMKDALQGVSASGAGATIIQAGIVAFWGVVAASASTIWVTAPPPTGAVPPPGLGSISMLLTTAFAVNAAGKLSLKDAANAVAIVLHATQLGGIALLPIPPGGPGPQPIL